MQTREQTATYVNSLLSPDGASCGDFVWGFCDLPRLRIQSTPHSATEQAIMTPTWKASVSEGQTNISVKPLIAKRRNTPRKQPARMRKRIVSDS